MFNRDTNKHPREKAGAVEALPGLQRVRPAVRSSLRVVKPVRRRGKLPQLPSLPAGNCVCVYHPIYSGGMWVL